MKIFILMISLSFLGCSTIGKMTDASFTLRKYEEIKLENGLQIILIPDNSLPRVSLTMLVKVGSVYDPAGQEGINALTAALLDQGTKTKSAEQLADAFNQLGTEISQSSSYDYTTIQVSGLSTSQAELLELYSDVILNPVFSDAEIRRNKSQTIAALKRIVDQPTAYADVVLAKEVFGQHPYAKRVMGNVSSVSRLGRRDLVGHYSKYYRPNNAILAIAGHFDDSFVDQAKKIFSKWKEQKIETPRLSALDKSAGGELKLVTKTDLKQTQIRWGQVGLQRNDPDFLKMRLAFIVLGGNFASRLMQHVRDDKGLTYSISATSDTRLMPGLLTISTFTRNEKAKETIEETNKVLKEFSEGGITAAELSSAKALLIGQFPAALETTDRLALNLMLLRLYGVSDDYLHSFHKWVGDITVDEVNGAIKKHFTPDKLDLIIYADQKAVESQIKSLGSLKIESATIH